MDKKKETKKSSLKEDKQVNNDIFDTNGKLILNNSEEKNVPQQIEKKKKPTNSKTVTNRYRTGLFRKIF